MTLHDTIRSDAAQVFCNASDFAESVVYYKRNGLSRTINAVVQREAFAINPEDGDTITPVFEVHVANDAATGIASNELNIGGDMLTFAVRVGKPAERRSITRLISHDEGMLVLECR
jgi:hypothetical protein